MYQPEHFKLEDRASLHEVICAHPLAQLFDEHGGEAVGEIEEVHVGKL